MKTLDLTVLLNSNDVTSHVTHMERHHNLCEPMSTGMFTIDTTYPPDLGADPIPYDRVDIYEEGTKVFMGWVLHKEQDTSGFTCNIAFADYVIKLQDCWITVPSGYTTNGETVQYWIGFFCDLAGVPYTLDTSDYVWTPRHDDAVNWDFMPVLTAVKQLCDVAGYYIYTTPDGTVHFSQGVGVTFSKTLSTGDDGNIVSFERNKNLDVTRNRAVVFGRYPDYAEYETTVPELSGRERTVVVASPLLENPLELAENLVDAFAHVEDVKTVEIEGDPDIRVGQCVKLREGWSGLNTNCLVTAVESTMDNSGYIMRITLDKMCPKVWGRNTPITTWGDMVAYDHEHGCHVLYDTLWVNVNDGLTGADTYDNHGTVDYLKTTASGRYFWKVEDSSVFLSTDGGATWNDKTPTGSLPEAWNSESYTVADMTFVQVECNRVIEDEVYLLGYTREPNSGQNYYRTWIGKSSDYGDTWDWYGLAGWWTFGTSNTIFFKKPYWVGKLHTPDNSYFYNPTASESRVDCTYGKVDTYYPSTETIKFVYHDDEYCNANLDFLFPSGIHLLPAGGQVRVKTRALIAGSQPDKRRMFTRTFGSKIYVNERWTQFNNWGAVMETQLFTADTDTYADGPWFNLEGDPAHGKTEIGALRVTWEPQWNISPAGAGEGAEGYIQYVQVNYATGSITGPLNMYPIRMDIDNYDGSLLWTTQYFGASFANPMGQIHVVAINTSDMTVEYYLIIGGCFMYDSTSNEHSFQGTMYSLNNVIDKTYFFAPRCAPAGVAEPNQCYLYGRHPNWFVPDGFQISHLIKINSLDFTTYTFDETWMDGEIDGWQAWWPDLTEIENGFDTDIISAFRVGEDGIMNALRSEYEVSSKLYRGSSSLAYVSDAPFYAHHDGFTLEDLLPSTSGSARVAVGAAVGETYMVSESSSPYSSWANITYDYPINGMINGLYYLS